MFLKKDERTSQKAPLAQRSIKELCSESAEKPPVRTEAVLENLRLFKIESSKKAFQRFQHVQILCSSEIFLTRVFSVDELKTDAVDANVGYLK